MNLSDRLAALHAVAVDKFRTRHVQSATITEYEATRAVAKMYEAIASMGAFATHRSIDRARATGELMRAKESAQDAHVALCRAFSSYMGEA